MALYDKGEVDVHIELRQLNQLALKWGISSDGPDGPNVIILILEGRGRRKRNRKMAA